MPIDVVMPQMGESITEGTLTKWLKRPGEAVTRDEPLFEISTDKVDAEIPSPAGGVLGDIKVQEGATVGVGTVVCSILGAEETASQAAPAKAAEPASASGAAPAKAAPVSGSGPAAEAAMGSATEVLMPQMGESITEGTLTRWLKKVGDAVARDEPIFEISTDKVDAEIPSPAAGVLAEIRVGEGQTVTINTVVAVIRTASTEAAAAAPQVQAAPPGAVAPAAPTAAGSSNGASAGPAAEGETPRSSPLVRKMAAENNIDLRSLTGTGASGRITKQDILRRLQEPLAVPAAPVVAAPPVSAPAPVTTAAPSASAPSPAAPSSAPLPGELVPLSRMRSIIAKRMVESKATSPHVHTVFKVDMTRIVRLREREKSKYEQRNGVKLTYMPFIARAAVQALRKHAIVNASMQGEAIQYHRNINLGIAVALEWGLIVPVIQQAEEKSFLGVARAIADVAERARAKKLAPEEVAGGTFTLTNSGIFGEQFGLPIIAQPQSAILGIGGLSKEPVVVTGEDGQDSIAIRSMQHFALGFDHRIIDGADAGKFMADFKACLENWSEDIG